MQFIFNFENGSYTRKWIEPIYIDENGKTFKNATISITRYFKPFKHYCTPAQRTERSTILSNARDAIRYQKLRYKEPTTITIIK